MAGHYLNIPLKCLVIVSPSKIDLCLYWCLSKLTLKFNGTIYSLTCPRPGMSAEIQDDASVPQTPPGLLSLTDGI